jgi:hypothetical protein
MLSYEKRIDLARRFVADACIVEAERDDTTTYIVKDIGAVIAAYAADLEVLEDVYDNTPWLELTEAISNYFEDDVGEFFARHNIAWK